YAIAAHLPMEAILPAYVYFWSLPSIGFFLILIALDRDPARIKRYVILYAVAWIVCGNLLAMAGSSVGPVYYDRLLETDRFTDLLAALQSGAVNGSFIERLQGNLWDLHESGNQALGSGISAFPSVHVSSTMVLALYAHDRLGRVGTVAGSALVAVILFLSVYTGYHYAVDGYASIAMMLFAYAYLKQPSKRGAPKPEVQAA
ncbi:MAG: phosphatase PAP2 family protein, partial [Pseudomonadota bacterium]